MRSDKHIDVVLEIRQLLDERLGLTMKNHGAWRIQFLIDDELEEREEIQQVKNNASNQIRRNILYDQIKENK
tara:strand:- start:1134 stop:1349 length:216 start_codon:yes stop_codon:yes gene_type:complete